MKTSTPYQVFDLWDGCGRDKVEERFIELTHTYAVVGLSRQEMIFDKEKLLAVYDATVEKKPM